MYYLIECGCFFIMLKRKMFKKLGYLLFRNLYLLVNLKNYERYLKLLNLVLFSSLSRCWVYFKIKNVWY